MRRQKFIQKKVLLRGQPQLDALLALIPHLPLDAEHPIEVIAREEQKVRKPDQNSHMWSGPLRDIAEQAWVEGRRYSAEVWHENFKRLYLPEDDDPNLGELAKEGYRKWDYLPSGERVLVGSTTQLLVKGMTIYLTQVEADGASMGVMFSESPRSRMAA